MGLRLRILERLLRKCSVWRKRVRKRILVEVVRKEINGQYFVKRLDEIFDFFFQFLSNNKFNFYGINFMPL